VNNTPIITYHDAYFYFELYEEYIQIHQHNRIIIPYRGVIKNDGEKIYFRELKSIYFFKELKAYHDSYHQKDKVGWVYECKLKGKHTSFKSIRNVIHGDQGRNQIEKTEEYGKFVRQLIEKVLPHHPKIYTNSGLTNLINKKLPFLKLDKVPTYMFVLMATLPVILLDNLDYLLAFLGFEFDSWAFFTLGLVGYVVPISTFIISRFWKKTLIWEEVEQEYLPLKPE